ncbi:MAG: class I SAM-dependent methyltransferase [Firmicutes bacterium]|nr:class I SAM-dependent methyltransferase [Bacillota bacterium]
MRESAAWVAKLHKGGDLLDLGCGPGLYAEMFDDAGFKVTGIDMSKRSIEHAAASAKAKGKDIRYLQKNYLCIDYENAFDIVTLIYCDYGVFPPSTRARLLKKVCRALRPGGLFITDVWSEKAFGRFEENQRVTEARGGFWSPDPYVCVKRNIRYDPAVMLEAYHVVTAADLRTYYIWNQAFACEDLTRELHAAGFSDVVCYADVCGRARDGEDETLCALAQKKQTLI